MTMNEFEGADEGFGPGEDVAPILERALQRAEDGEWDAMAAILREALEEKGENAYFLCWLGLAERELGLEGIAYERFKRCVAIETRDPVVLATVGNALASFDDPDAEAALRTAALLAPDLPQARWMYGAYLAREGFLREGVEELEAAVELAVDDPLIRVELGVAHALSDDLATAATAFHQGLELDPEDGWTMILLGLTRVALGDVDEGAPLLEEGARMRPEDMEAQFLAALAWCAEGWDERALEMLERGRLHAEEVDASLVAEVEARLEEGSEAARTFLSTTLAPSSFRERLMLRP